MPKGLRGFQKGQKFTLEHRKKLSEAKNGKPGPFMNKKWCKNISKSLKGRKITWVDKMKKSHKVSEEGKNQMRLNLIKARKNGRNITKLVKHHIYLEENSPETITMTRKQHRQLHARAYDFIYYKYGKQGIQDLLSWFKETYADSKYIQ